MTGERSIPARRRDGRESPVLKVFVSCAVAIGACHT